MRPMFALVLSLWMPVSGFAAVYYIDKDHVSASDSNAGTSQSAPWSTISKANSTLVAGDTVYLKAGTYTAGTTNYIAPANSGTAGNRITYQNYASDAVIVQQGEYAILLNGDDYITVKGITFQQLDHFMVLNGGADYNIIDGNTFSTMRNFDDWAGSRIWQNSDHNIIKNNTFEQWGACTAGSDDGAVLDVGDENASGDDSSNNVFENNIFARGGHHTLGLFGRYSVVRNNYFYNDAWTNGAGNRSFYMVGFPGYAGFNLIENNRIGHSAVPCDQGGASGMTFATPSNIFRLNDVYYNNLSGMDMTTYDVDTSLNLIYRNTFAGNACTTGCGPNQIDYDARYFGAITLNDFNAPAMVNNRIKDNLYYSHALDGDQPIGQNGGLRANQTISGNIDGDVSGNPNFVSFTGTPPVDKTDRTTPNLNLQAGSLAIDVGNALTTVTSGCSGSTSQIVLADATYFYDGSWGVTGETQADWIAVGTVSNVVQISAISGNTVSLASSISCSNGASVWLYKDSAGRVVLSGTAPDVGAHEYSAAVPRFSPVLNLRVAEAQP